jgi:hypothetical protein
MPLVVLNCELKHRPRGMGRRYSRVKKEVLKEVAWHWHAKILERHFTPGNSSRYRMATRNKVYREFIKKEQGTGQGRFVDLLLRGQSLRRMRHFSSVTGTQYYATLTMNTPTYFTRPFIGTFTDPNTGRVKRVSRQPDKPGEVKQISNDDRAMLTRFARRGIVRGWNTGSVPSGRGA